MRPPITIKFSMWPSVENVCPPLPMAVYIITKLAAPTNDENVCNFDISDRILIDRD